MKVKIHRLQTGLYHARLISTSECGNDWVLEHYTCATLEQAKKWQAGKTSPLLRAGEKGKE